MVIEPNPVRYPHDCSRFSGNRGNTDETGRGYCSETLLDVGPLAPVSAGLPGEGRKLHAIGSTFPKRTTIVPVRLAWNRCPDSTIRQPAEFSRQIQAGETLVGRAIGNGVGSPASSAASVPPAPPCPLAFCCASFVAGVQEVPITAKSSKPRIRDWYTALPRRSFRTKGRHTGRRNRRGLVGRVRMSPWSAPIGAFPCRRSDP